MAKLVCADNTGAKILQIAQVTRIKGRHSRLPSAAVGDFVTVTVKKGPAELRKQIFGAVIVRQKYAVRRLNGVRVSFEDNAAVLVTKEGEIKGTDIKGPVAVEAAEIRVSFEDNAAVLVTKEGEIKGTDIKGPVAVEAAEKWPRIANLASMII